MSKVGTPKITGSVLTAAQHSPFLQQSERIIPNTGGTLIIDDIIQFGRGIISYATIGSFFQDDSTIANTIVLNQQGDFDTPQDAVETWNGMLIRFRPKFANTGNATVNLAGLNGGTPINIVNESGVALSAGELSINRDAFLRYDLPNTRFILVNSTLQSAVATLQSQIIPATTTTQGIAYLNKPITLTYNSTTVVNYTAGTFQFDDGTGQSVLTAGSVDFTTTGAGGLDVGSVANDTQYDIYAINNPTSGVSSVIATLATAGSPSTPTFPVGYTKKAYINTVMTDGSGNIRAFTQVGKRITLNGSSYVTHNLVGQNKSTETARDLSTAGVPLGRKVKVFGEIYGRYTAGSYICYFQIYDGNITKSAINTFEGYNTHAFSQGPTIGSGPWSAVVNENAEVKTNCMTTNSAGTPISGTELAVSLKIMVSGWELID
jgi:hypothetical protein